ncbi:hypothetical protein BOX15_Mlig027520g1 [Macrostomum lignano]|uniref:Uncharacterized protein n=2 Tax=Macrostomum lignano TaxID=282301 RepID=A0A267EYU1_9PLAT|nr:hypothetical protein BOX15_Mlig027520g1 [Macrostomum lignano]
MSQSATRKSNSSLVLTASAPPDGVFQSAKVFEAIRAGLAEEGKELVNRIKGVFAFKVTGGRDGAEGLWIVDCKTGTGSVEFGGKGKPDVTLTISDVDLLQLMSGRLNPQQAFFTGRLKLQGNMGLGMRLKEFQTKLSGKL